MYKQRPLVAGLGTAHVVTCRLSRCSVWGSLTSSEAQGLFLIFSRFSFSLWVIFFYSELLQRFVWQAGVSSNFLIPFQTSDVCTIGLNLPPHLISHASGRTVRKEIEDQGYRVRARGYSQPHLDV